MDVLCNLWFGMFYKVTLKTSEPWDNPLTAVVLHMGNQERIDTGAKGACAPLPFYLISTIQSKLANPIFFDKYEVLLCFTDFLRIQIWMRAF